MWVKNKFDVLYSIIQTFFNTVIDGRKKKYFFYNFFLKNGLDKSKQVTVFKKLTTTLSLKQDIFRSFNDHIQL